MGAVQKKLKVGGVDLTILPNGTVKFVATPTLDGVPTPLPSGTPIPTWSTSDQGLSVVQDLTNDPSGLTAIGTGVSPEVGAVATISATLPNGTVISGAADPVDVVAAPANPNGFVIVESTP